MLSSERSEPDFRVSRANSNGKVGVGRACACAGARLEKSKSGGEARSVLRHHLLDLQLFVHLGSENAEAADDFSDFINLPIKLSILLLYAL